MTVTVALSQLKRIVVAIDPSVTNNEESDETGIIVVGRGPHQPDTCKFDTRCPGHGYVLGDYTLKGSPHDWARKAVLALDEWRADRIVAEVNNGGDMVGATIHAIRLGIPYSDVRATRGKLTRAEPVAALYEQGRMHHVGEFPKLEDQLVNWAGEGPSPDRMDALVWGVTFLQLIGGQGAAFLAAWQDSLDNPSHASALPSSDPATPPQQRAGFVNFHKFESSPYQTECSRSTNRRHRFFGSPAQCVQCGCDSPVRLLEAN